MKYNNIFNIYSYKPLYMFLIVSTSVKAVACLRFFPVLLGLLGGTSNETSLPHHHVSFYSCLLEMVLHNFLHSTHFPRQCLACHVSHISTEFFF